MTIELKQIRTRAEHKAALKELDRLWGAKRGTPDGDRFYLLALIVEDYEKKEFPIGKPDPISAIEFRLEQLGLDRKALEPAIGTRARVSEVLNRKRDLTLPMIRRLVKMFDIPADVLIQPTVNQKERV